MKKAVLLFISVLTVLLLAGCAIGKPEVPEWAQEDEIYANTYLAVKEICAPDAKEVTDDLKYLKYDPKFKIPYLVFSDEMSDKDYKALKEALKPIWDGKDLPMFGAGADSLTDSKVRMLNFFSSFNCKSMALHMPIVQISSDWRLNEEDAYDLSGIQGLKTLVLDSDNVTINDEDGVNPCKDVKELTIPGENVLVSTEDYFPNTEKLYLFEINDQVPEYLHLAPSVSEVTYTKQNGKDVESSREVYDFFTTLKEMDQIKKINGVDKDKFEIPVDDEIKQEAEAEAEAEKRAAQVEAVTSQLDQFKGIDTKKEEGTPKLGNKIIVKLDDEYSVSSALDGEDFYGIPADRLAKTFEEADTYLNIHPFHEPVGSYTNGAIAYKTHTMVITFDIKNGGKRAAKRIGSEDPPKTITSYNNIPTLAGSGKFLQDEALEYVKKLL